MGSKSLKGGVFEREFAKNLSLWWSDGKHDDWFWRSSTSGARATVRAKSGKRTANSAGDICAQTAEGQKLLNILTFELKRGYNALSIQDLLDCKGRCQWLEFVQQAQASASLAGTPLWALVLRRDKRREVIVFNADSSELDLRDRGMGYGDMQLITLEEFFENPNVKTYFRRLAEG